MKAKKVSQTKTKAKNVAQKKNKKNSQKKTKAKKQVGGQEVSIGSAYIVSRDRAPTQKDDLILKKNDIIYIVDSPKGNRWLGISHNAVEKALAAKKRKENTSDVVTQLIEFFYKSPSSLNPSLFGELIGWFPIEFVKQTPASPVSVVSLISVVSPVSPFSPQVIRKLENVPKRKIKN